jgi:hypothetical protein
MRVRDPDPNAQRYERRHSGKAENQSECDFAEFLNYWGVKSQRTDSAVGPRRVKPRLLAFPSLA